MRIEADDDLASRSAQRRVQTGRRVSGWILDDGSACSPGDAGSLIGRAPVGDDHLHSAFDALLQD